MTIRDRLIEAGYRLFCEHGVRATGVNLIASTSGCGKSSLYELFGSKDNFALVVMCHHEQQWTETWLEVELAARATDPVAGLLAIFDIYDEWLQSEEFMGCLFSKVLHEYAPGSELHAAAAAHQRTIGAIPQRFALAAGLSAPEEFAEAWHMLMLGSVASAGAGNRSAARHAKSAAKHILNEWPRR